MAKFEFKGINEYDKMLVKLGDQYDPICQSMLSKAVQIAANALRQATSVFAKHIKPKKAKHNQYGWFAQVHFGGQIKNRSNTGSGTNAARAAVIYEYGRTAGTYTDKKGHKRHFPAQPARPFIKRSMAECEQQVVDAMQEVYDEAVKKL